MTSRGIRGATTVESNTEEEILRETRFLLALMVKLNEIRVEDLGSVILTATQDLDASFPATAARQLFGPNVALLCAREIAVPGSIQRCIRVLMHWNTEKTQDEILSVYINRAESLIADEPPEYDRQAHEAWVDENLEKVKENMKELSDERRRHHT